VPDLLIESLGAIVAAARCMACEAPGLAARRRRGAAQPPASSSAAIATCAHPGSVGTACAQKLWGASRNGSEFTPVVTASPDPGPAPEGPSAAPQQSFSAFRTETNPQQLPMAPPTGAGLRAKQLSAIGPVTLVDARIAPATPPAVFDRKLLASTVTFPSDPLVIAPPLAPELLPTNVPVAALSTPLEKSMIAPPSLSA
jgi:hypothetical protein